MKKYFLLLILFLFLCVVLFVLRLEGNHSVKLEKDGDTFEVMIFKLPEPVRIDPLYKPENSENTNSYAWFKALLFQLNGFELSIPEEEWPQYADGDWPPERYASIKKYNERLSRSVLEEQKEYWMGKYYQIANVVRCDTDDSSYLSFRLGLMNADGSYSGNSRYVRVKLIDGAWKRTLEPNGRARAKQLSYCYDQALKAMETGNLKSRSANKIKN